MSTEDLNMSAATKNVLAKVRRIIPPMLESFHKGLYLRGLAGVD